MPRSRRHEPQDARAFAVCSAHRAVCRRLLAPERWSSAGLWASLIPVFVGFTFYASEVVRANAALSGDGEGDAQLFAMPAAISPSWNLSRATITVGSLFGFVSSWRLTRASV